MFSSSSYKDMFTITLSTAPGAVAGLGAWPNEKPGAFPAVGFLLAASKLKDMTAADALAQLYILVAAARGLENGGGGANRNLKAQCTHALR